MTELASPKVCDGSMTYGHSITLLNLDGCKTLPTSNLYGGLTGFPDSRGRS